MLCLSGMTKSKKFVMRVQEKTLSPVMQKRSLSCEKRNTITKKRRYFSCLAVHDREFIIPNAALQVSRPRHFCNPYEYDHKYFYFNHEQTLKMRQSYVFLGTVLTFVLICIAKVSYS